MDNRTVDRRRLARPERNCSARRFCLLLAGLMAVHGCAAFRPMHGVPASYAPAELLGQSREGRRTINLSLLVQRPPDQYRVEAGDVLAVYIPGLLGSRSVIGPGLGGQIVGEAPPVTAPANMIDAPTFGYPITVRDDNTLVLPQLDPINVYRLTLQEIEQTIKRVTLQANILPDKNVEIMVALWRPREYRVLVVRQEATEEVGSTTMMLGTVNPGRSKRGSGHVVRLRAFENDVLHALSTSDATAAGPGGPSGLPGLDAENAVYIIRRNPHRTARPADQLLSDPVGMPPGPMTPVPPRADSGWPGSNAPTRFGTPAATGILVPMPQRSDSAASANQLPVVNAGPDRLQAAPIEQDFAAPPAAPAPSPKYGTPENGLPILPQSYEVIRGQNGRTSLLNALRASSAAVAVPSADSRAAEIARGHSTSSPANEVTTMAFAVPAPAPQTQVQPAAWAAGSPYDMQGSAGIYAPTSGPVGMQYANSAAVASPYQSPYSVSSGAPAYAGQALAPATGSGSPYAAPFGARNGTGQMNLAPAAGLAPVGNPLSSPYSTFMSPGPQSQPVPTLAPRMAGNTMSPYGSSRSMMTNYAASASNDAGQSASPANGLESDAQGMFPDEFGYDDFTIDSPNVIRIPIRLAPGQSPNISEQDITLYDGDIVFIESRDTEVFYTGGLLGGGEYMLPRDRDLHATEAVSVAQARIQTGGLVTGIGGVSALNGDVSISPSRLIVRRRLDDGRVVPIEIDLYRARLHPEEDILVQPHDLLLLQYTSGEAVCAFVERHLLSGALFTVAASSFTTRR